ncbi:MAG TPA: phage terminase large subunit, partial [Candidatus Acidoferrum sp.]|nr:phage terminase large subunit [Candidatus Acidoferrum sp.]
DRVAPPAAAADGVSTGGGSRWVKGSGAGNGGELFLLHVYRARLEYPELKRMVRTHAALWEAKNVLIEDKASGTQLCQELIQEGMHSVKKCQSTLDKGTRMLTVTPTIENGFVYLPEKAPWLSQYLHEMATFPNGKHDDQADSTSQALDWMKSFLFEPGIVQYYRREAEKLKTEQQQTEPDPPPRLTREWYYRTHGMR